MAVVYVLNKDGNPLMPTTRCGHVRRLLKAKQARVVSRKPFTIQLLYKVEDAVQDLVLGIDPGRTNIGVAVVRETGECVYAAKVETRNKEIPKLMQARAGFRRKHRKNGRRDVRLRRAKAAGTRKADFERTLPGCEKPIHLKGIRNKEARFLNRRRPAGWLTPTANQLLQTHVNLVAKIAKILPITKVVVELNRFAFMAMDDPNIKRWEYQRGPLYKFGSVEDAVYAQQDGKCLFCSADIEHYHHVVPRSKGGDETIANRVGLCLEHHKLVHTSDEWEAKLAKLSAGRNKRYHALSVLNQIIPALLSELSAMYPEATYATSGKDTKAFRDTFDIAKDHDLDAYCVACSILDVDIAKPPEMCFNIRQFRRRDRQACHQERVNRKYYLGKKLVATNRHKAFEQTAGSLEDYINAGGKTDVLITKPHPAVYKNTKRWLPGCVVQANGKRHILIGTHGTQPGRDGTRRPSMCRFGDGTDALYSKSKYLCQNSGLVYM